MGLWERWLAVPGRRKILGGVIVGSFAALGLYLSPLPDTPEGLHTSPLDRPPPRAQAPQQ